jgi:hypothetical protein
MHRTAKLLTFAVILLAGLIVGCDTNAERELRRAEKALDDAMAVNADAYATEDYNEAEAAFDEAQQLAKDNRIQEARTAAIKAKLSAEDARRKAEERKAILESEMDRLGK